MPIVHSLRNNRARPRRRSKFMPVNRCRPAPRRLAPGADVAHGNSLNRRVRGFGHPADINPLVDDYFVLDPVVVDDRCVIVESRYLRWWQPAMSKVMVAKISKCDEGE